MKRTVTVTGHGEASAPPDVAVLELGAECVARHAPDALGDASSALTRMRAVAVEAGVGVADLATTTTSLWPDLGPDGHPAGYRAALGLSIRLRDLVAASELVPALLAAGGDAGRLHSTSLQHSDPAALASAARDAAFADARAKAEQLAGLSGSELGDVLDIVEGGGRGGPAPMFKRESMALAASMPIEPGSAAVSASVTVRWALV